MEKPNQLLKVIAQNIQSIAQLSEYSALDRDVILQYLRTVYGVIVQSQPTISFNQENIQLHVVGQNEGFNTQIAELKTLLEEKEKEMHEQANSLAAIQSEMQQKNQLVQQQISALEKVQIEIAEKNHAIELKNIQIEKLNQQIEIQKQQFDQEKEALRSAIKETHATIETPITEVVKAPIAEEETLTPKESIISDFPITEDLAILLDEVEEEEVVIENTTPVIETPKPQTMAEEPVLDLFNTSTLEAKEIENTIQLTPAPEAPSKTQVQAPQTDATAHKKSLSDYLHDGKEDNSIASKYQNSKITDLSKAITINDKFLYIRELFNQRGEEFKDALSELNNCQTLDTAFELLEKYRQHYFWDTSTSAYLSFCDLIRRKYS